MSAQRIGVKLLRRIGRMIGEEPPLRGWSHGGYTIGFVTADHRHGYWDKKTDEIEWADLDDRWAHYSTCEETWPGYERPWRDTPSDAGS